MKLAHTSLPLAFLVLAVPSLTAQAEVLSAVEPTGISQRGLSHQQGGWEYALEPYLWFAGVDGKTGIGPLGPFSVDMDFGDIWDNLNFGAMLAVEFGPRNRPWSILLDTLYLDLEAEKRSIDFAYEQGFIEASFAWEVPYQRETQLLAGVRAWALQPSIEMPNGRSIEVEEEWLDPVFGFRYLMPTEMEYDVYLRADVGGFGMGSDLTWQVAGGVRWRMGQNSTFGLGYRHMQLEYDDRGVDLDVAFSGPLVGLTWSR